MIQTERRELRHFKEVFIAKEAEAVFLLPV